MKLIKVSMELVIDDDAKFLIPETITGGVYKPRYDKDAISSYLNNKLYNDPEFFGEFGSENIDSVEEFV